MSAVDFFSVALKYRQMFKANKQQRRVVQVGSILENTLIGSLEICAAKSLFSIVCKGNMLFRHMRPGTPISVSEHLSVFWKALTANGR